MLLPSLNSKFKELLFNHEKLKSILKVFSYISKGFPYFPSKYQKFKMVSIDFGSDYEDPVITTLLRSSLEDSGEFTFTVSGEMEPTEWIREYFVFGREDTPQGSEPHPHSIDDSEDSDE
jgi:hypothetical protein